MKVTFLMMILENKHESLVSGNVWWTATRFESHSPLAHELLSHTIYKVLWK